MYSKREFLRIDKNKEKHFNPFVDLFEDQANPNARTLRTHFWGKLSDTMNVFVGTKKHLGLFDYLLLLLPYLVEKLNHWFETTSWGRFDSNVANIIVSLVQGILSLPFRLLNFAFSAARYIAAYPFLLVASPFIGIAHGISKIEGDPLKDRIDNWLEQPGISSEERLKLDVMEGTNNHQIMVRLTKTDGDKNNFLKEQGLDLENPEEAEIIEALKALNVDGAAKKIAALGILGGRDHDDDSDQIILLNNNK